MLKLLQQRSRSHWWPLGFTFMALYLGAMFDGMDANLFSAVLPTALPELLQTKDTVVISRIGSWITVVFLLGWSFGGMLFGWLGDRLGRIKVLTFSILLYALFTGLCGTAQTWEALACFRFFAALGIGGELVIGSTFLSETWPEESRTRAIGYLTTAYQAGGGLVGVALLLFQNYDWRVLFFVGALPVVLVVLIRSWVPESKRWLEVQEQKQDPSAVVKDSMDWFELMQHVRLLIAASIFVGANSVAYWACLFWIPAWLYQLIPDHKPVLELSLALGIQGLCCVMGCIVAGYLVKTLGRKWTISIGLFGFFLSVLALFGANTVFSPFIYGSIGWVGFFNGLTIGVCYVFVPELFPTRLRATSMGLCFNMGRLAAAVGVVISSKLIEYFEGSYSEAVMVSATVLLFGMIAVAFVPETKGRALQN